MADVFISYARSSEKIARRIADALRSSGYSVWFDEEIPAHLAYADVISDRLEEAKAVMVIWSRDAAVSQWVRSEANRARETGRLVQARVDDARLPMPFDQLQCVDLGEWKANLNSPSWRRVVESVSELVHGHGARAQRPESASAHHVGRASVGRRSLMIGGSAAVLAAAGALVWWPRGSDEPPPEAAVLFQKALAIMQDGRPAEQNQAIAYLVEATRIAPGFAKAWGALAVTYALRKFQVPLASRAGEDARCRSAARTALKLNSDEPMASCALTLRIPPYRNWGSIEQRARGLAGRFPELPMALHLLADVLADVGRWRDSVEIYRRVDRKRFFVPLSERNIIQALWSTGDLQGTETMLAQAIERWPQHRAIWDLRLTFLTHSGRTDEAIRLLENYSARPSGYPDDLLRASLSTARALAGTIGRDDAIGDNLSVLRRNSVDVLTNLNRKLPLAHIVAQRCATLGDTDTAFALLDGYYRARGAWARLAPAAGDADRSTVALFEPPMETLWRDVRFAELLREIGLENYWSSTRTAPDLRTA